MPVPDFSVGEVFTASAADQIGLWLVKTETIGTAVPTVTVSDCFSSAYDNYRIVWNMNSASATANVQFQFNNATTNDYYTNAIYMGWTATTMTGYGPAATNHIVIGFSANANVAAGSLDVFRPNAAVRTALVSQSSSNANYFTGGGLHGTTAQHTGFNITLSASATMTGGTVRVYGYRN